jgi:hypothetical protein
MGVWDRVAVTGTWRNTQGDLLAGKWLATLFNRATNTVDTSMLSAGLIGSGELSLVEPGPSLNIPVPASDDPQVGINDFEIEIEIDPKDGPIEIYRLITLMSMAGTGLDLSDVFPYIGGTLPGAPAPILIKNIPGGIAGLDGTGRVPLANMPIYVDPVSIVGFPDGTLIARTS